MHCLPSLLIHEALAALEEQKQTSDWQQHPVDKNKMLNSEVRVVLSCVMSRAKEENAHSAGLAAASKTSILCVVGDEYAGSVLPVPVGHAMTW